MKQQEQYLKELLEVGRKDKVNELELARIFHNAYDRHKRIYGSNKFKTEDYGEEMDKRYKFMYQKGLEYIATTKMERKYGFRSKIEESAGISTCHNE